MSHDYGRALAAIRYGTTPPNPINFGDNQHLLWKLLADTLDAIVHGDRDRLPVIPLDDATAVHLSTKPPEWVAVCDSAQHLYGLRLELGVSHNDVSGTSIHHLKFEPNPDVDLPRTARTVPGTYDVDVAVSGDMTDSRMELMLEFSPSDLGGTTIAVLNPDGSQSEIISEEQAGGRLKRDMDPSNWLFLAMESRLDSPNLERTERAICRNIKACSDWIAGQPKDNMVHWAIVPTHAGRLFANHFQRGNFYIEIAATGDRFATADMKVVNRTRDADVFEYAPDIPLSIDGRHDDMLAVPIIVCSGGDEPLATRDVVKALAYVQRDSKHVAEVDWI